MRGDLRIGLAFAVVISLLALHAPAARAPPARRSQLTPQSCWPRMSPAASTTKSTRLSGAGMPMRSRASNS